MVSLCQLALCGCCVVTGLCAPSRIEVDKDMWRYCHAQYSRCVCVTSITCVIRSCMRASVVQQTHWHCLTVDNQDVSVSVW